MKPVIAFNGKFLAASPTGVHRVARELVLGIDKLIAERPEAQALDWEMICPPDVRELMELEHIRAYKVGPLTWQPWEQFQLPLAARGKLLINLCNLAPILAERAITMIHDAQVFITPDSYSRAFGKWYRHVLPEAGARSERILTVSRFSRGRLAAYGVAPLSKVQVIHNGVDHVLGVASDIDAAARLGVVPGRYAVGLANTQPHKNIPLLFQAFARPELKDLKLVLIGSAGAEDFTSRGFDIPPNVVFAGRVSDEALRGLMEQALCTAFPSTTEGFGLPPLEGMAVGCPAVVAPRGALPEACGDAALYADAASPEEWARQIRRFADEPALRRDMIERGRARAAQFTWDQAAAQLMDVILDVTRRQENR